MSQQNNAELFRAAECDAVSFLQRWPQPPSHAASPCTQTFASRRTSVQEGAATEPAPRLARTASHSSTALLENSVWSFSLAPSWPAQTLHACSSTRWSPPASPGPNTHSSEEMYFKSSDSQRGDVAREVTPCQLQQTMPDISTEFATHDVSSDSEAEEDSRSRGASLLTSYELETRAKASWVLGGLKIKGSRKVALFDATPDEWLDGHSSVDDGILGADASTEPATSLADSAEVTELATSLGDSAEVSLQYPSCIDSYEAFTPVQLHDPAFDSIVFSSLMEAQWARERLALEFGIERVPDWEECAHTRIYTRDVLVYARLCGAGAGKLSREVAMPMAYGIEDFRGLTETVDVNRIFMSRRSGAGKWRDAQLPALRPSENGYRIQVPQSRADEIRRHVNSLLNKICPDNLGRIVKQMAEVLLHSADELELVINMIFQAALTNSHYCETYADMVFAIKTRYPSFRVDGEGREAVTFTRTLLSMCQGEFENLREALEPTAEELADGISTREEIIRRRRDRTLAHMRFLGQLFLRKLLPPKILHFIVGDLLESQADAACPQEHMVECACELLTTIGYTLETTEAGKRLMETASLRLSGLKTSACDKDGCPVFSKRLRFRIDDLLELRERNWHKKLYRETARTLDEIRQDKGGGLFGQAFITTRTGVQPAYMASEVSSKLDAGHSLQAADLAPTLKISEISNVCFETTNFNRDFVDRSFSDFSQLPVGKRDVDALCHRWRSLARSAADISQGARWLLEADDEKSAAEVICALMAHGILGWQQLLSSASSSSSDCGSASSSSSDCRIRTSALGALIARSLSDGVFSSTAFRCLPSQPDAAWDILTIALCRLRQIGAMVAHRQGVAEFWEVLCALRGVPTENSEQDLINELIEDGITIDEIAQEFAHFSV